MATQISNYQCPACTGPLQFDAASGKLACEYCGSSFEVAEIEAQRQAQEEKAAQAMAGEAEADLGEETPWDASALNTDWGGEAAAMRAYSCPSCGAELICEETTTATACPYCGNPTVVPGNFAGALRPDYVIPFKLDKNKAMAALKKHFQGKLLLPGTFREKNTIEKIQGIYVPFWLYDGEVSGNRSYAATRTRVCRRGDWRITETSHFNIRRGGSLAFEKVPVDASKKMPDQYMDSIEPFDYGELKAFSSAYLPGFLADKYDVTVEEANARADQRCVNTLDSELQSTVLGYATCVPLGGSTRMKRGKVHYAMLPVWLLNVKWEGRDFLFAINGQTGKTAGDLPISNKRMLGLFAALAAPLSILGALLGLALGG